MIMSVQALIFVSPPEGGRTTTDSWASALWLPLGREPAIVHYGRCIARCADLTQLFIPASLAERLPRGAVGRPNVHIYERSFGEGSFRRAEPASTITETILIDAGRLARINIESALSLHRQSGAGMSVFCKPAQEDYCSELVTTDASGGIRTAVRRYADSWSACTADPVVVILSRRTWRPDPAAPITSFPQLVDHLKERMRRAGDRIHCQHHPAVRCHPRALDALLSLIECVSPPRTLLSVIESEPTAPQARVRSPVWIGKDVRIEPGAMIIGPAALGDASHIGAGAVVSRSVILPGGSIEANSRCHSQVIGPGIESFADVRVSLSRSCTAEDAAGNGQQASHAVRRSRPGAYDFLKRGFDLVSAALGLVLLVPVFVLAAVAVKWSSPGPVLFRHRRQGLRGVEFDCLKFRTMVQDADSLQKQLRSRNQVDGPQFKLEDDPRVTRVGAWLRWTNVDELPQLINVVRGQMSLVGPRPSPDRENQCCPAWRRVRLSVRPGITGLWQVARSADRQFTDFQEWIYFDTRYVENRSLRLDLQIIWQTARIMLGLGPGSRWCARWRPRPADRPAEQVAGASVPLGHSVTPAGGY